MRVETRVLFALENLFDSCLRMVNILGEYCHEPQHIVFCGARKNFFVIQVTCEQVVMGGAHEPRTVHLAHYRATWGNARLGDEVGWICTLWQPCGA